MSPASPSRFTVFLDRDGVFNVNPNIGLRFYRNLQWLPGAREAFARLNRPDVQTSLATNQPWVGLCTATPGMMRRLHQKFKAELEAHGGRLDNIEIAFGPFGLFHAIGLLGGPKLGNGWRRLKPNGGMLADGAAALASRGSPVDKSRAVMVGDKVKDAQAAAAYGVPCILLATTYDEVRLAAQAAQAGVPVLAIVPDLAAAVDHILERLVPSRTPHGAADSADIGRGAGTNRSGRAQRQ